MSQVLEYSTDFFIKLLKNIGISACVIHSAEDYSHIPYVSSAVHAFRQTPDTIYRYILGKLQPHVLYHEVDHLQCHHYALLLPFEDEQTFLLVGPVRNSALTDNQILQILEGLDLSSSSRTVIQSQYNSLTKEQDINTVEGLLYGYCQEIFGEGESFTQENHSISPADYQNKVMDSLPGMLTSESKSLMPNMTVDELYAVENQMLDCIRAGNTKKIEQFFQNDGPQASLSDIEQRTPDTIRNFKNQCIIQNTLCRKTAERGGVPPIYIHQISSDFARQIEQITSVEEAVELIRYMARKYALLVQNRSINEYSLPVQRIITLIDTDLTADLTLRRFAQELNQNASYLSALFKKETGEALTDYVNSKRIEHALFLLNTTDLQVQTIANSCGIYDLSYFGKLFKKYVNMSPSAYRNSIR